MELIDLGEGLQPGLAALLSHSPMHSPSGKTVIETFIRGAPSLLSTKVFARGIKILEIAGAVIVGAWDHPRVSADALRVGESVSVLEDKCGVRRQRILHRAPIDLIEKIDVEVCDHGPTLNPQIRGRREIGLFDILQLVDESLLRAAVVAGIP